MSDQPTRIEGQVAQILNVRELAINIGSEAGVRTGQKFAVLAAKPLEVRDPKSKEILDTIDRPKVKVEAVEIRDKITICRTFRVVSGMASFFGATVLGSGSSPFPKSKHETLRLRDEGRLPELSEEDSYVKIGDRVVSISDDSLDL